MLRQLLSILSLAVFFTVFLSGSVAAQQIRIIGGNETTPGEYPFMAAILSSSGNPLSQFCGGSLISSTWVATAAHCVVDNNENAISPSSIRVGMGLHRLSSGGGTIHTIKRIVIHPDYDADSSQADFALLELNSAASQAPISVNTSSATLTGTTATAIGWGLTQAGNNDSASDVLREVDVPIVSNSTCSAAYGGGITSEMICAGFVSGGKDACQGDSGGPLVATVSGSQKLVGVTSFGQGCALPNFYGVYARVSQLQSFISQYVTLAPPPTATDGDYGLWNGFLGMTNIIELVNPSSSTITAQVNMFQMDGTLVSSNFYQIGGNSQQDVILNSLTGFATDSYGIVQVSSNVGGRVLFYRATDSSFTNFDFVFALPLQEGITGNSFVGFNTFQPSGNFADQQNLVANWLSIVNLSSTARTFTVLRYDEFGNQLSSSSVSVAAKSRSDFEAGHVNPGPSRVGLIKIQPQSGSAAYLAQLMRYGYAANNGFDFAFPLQTLAGSASTITVPLGSSFVAQNWLEVINASDSSNQVAVSFYNSAGAQQSSMTLSLSPRAQQHINVNLLLGNQAIGYARIASQSARAVVAESMFYYKDASTNSILSMYGSQARASQSSAKKGSFNLFLGMENYLRLSNPSDSSIGVSVVVSSIFSSGSSLNLTLPANSSQDLPLHSTSIYGTAVNTYGTVTVTPSGSNTVVEEILRLKKSSDGQVQFTAPTGLE